VEKYGTARQVTDDSIKRRMRVAWWVRKYRDTHSEYTITIAFPRQHWFTNEFHCYVVRILPVFFKYSPNRKSREVNRRMCFKMTTLRNSYQNEQTQASSAFTPLLHNLLQLQQESCIITRAANFKRRRFINAYQNRY
jgi:hypothetical protein